MLAAKRAKLCLLKFQTIAVAVTSAELPMCARPTTPTRHETVPCIRLDDLVPTAAVGPIKIDVEGYELQVLEGSSDTNGCSITTINSGGTFRHSSIPKIPLR